MLDDANSTITVFGGWRYLQIFKGSVKNTVKENPELRLEVVMKSVIRDVWEE